MATPQPDTRSERRKALDEQLVAEPLLPIPDPVPGERPRPLDLAHRRTRDRPQFDATEHASKLVHCLDRHLVGLFFAEVPPALRGPNCVCEGPAAWNDDRARRAAAAEFA